MKVSKNIFWNILKDDSINKISIPRYQRDYAQGREENLLIANRFIQDLYSSLKENIELSLGLIYGCLKDGELQIVDGQQRFTMLWLFHLYLAKNAKTDLYPLQKFTYKTRLAANRFCEFIASDLTIDKFNTKNIERSIMFLHTWKNDPTVEGMLKVLSRIEKIIPIEECATLFSRLTDIDTCPIIFDNLPIKDIASDSIYMLMNSRGLQLTVFEHFKSELYAQIDEENKVLKYKLDVTYTDYFWSVLSIEEINGALLDNSLLSYIQEFARVKAFRDDESFKSNMTANRKEWIKWFRDTDYCNKFENKIDALIKYASIEDSQKLLSSLKNINYDQRLELYAHLEFYNKIPNDALNWERVYSIWHRVISNVIKNTSNSARDYKNTIELMDIITNLVRFESDYDLYYAIAKSSDERKNKQWLQEKYKAHLISEGLIEESEIIRAEKISGFNGNIHFLLSFEDTRMGNLFNKSKFVSYTDIAYQLLNNRTKEKSNFSEDYLLMRSILTYEPQITKGIHLWDNFRYLYEYLKGSNDNASVVEIRRATRCLFEELNEYAHTEVKGIMENIVDRYQLKDNRSNIALWRMIKHKGILIHCTNNNYIYPYNGRMRLFFSKNWNWKDYDLEVKLVKDVVNICTLFNNKEIIGNIFENDDDIFYRNIENDSFPFNNIIVHLIVKDNHVSIGIMAEGYTSKIAPPSQWGPSKDNWWASVLTFPVGGFESHKKEIVKYKEYLESL